MSPFYAGIDLGARSSWLCIVDANGRKQQSCKTPNDAERILSLLEPYGPDLQAVVESTFNWYWLVDLLQDQKIHVKLAHPLYLKAIAYAKVKTDQVDAHTLAQLLRLDYIPEAFIYPRDLRPTRDLLRRRHRLVSQRSDLIRMLHFQLMSHNVTMFSRNTIRKLYGRHLRGLLSHRHDRQGGMALLRLIDAVDEQVQRLEEEIFASVFRKKPVVLLKRVLPRYSGHFRIG